MKEIKKTVSDYVAATLIYRGVNLFAENEDVLNAVYVKTFGGDVYLHVQEHASVHAAELPADSDPTGAMQ